MKETVARPVGGMESPPITSQRKLLVPDRQHGALSFGELLNGAGGVDDRKGSGAARSSKCEFTEEVKECSADSMLGASAVGTLTLFHGRGFLDGDVGSKAGLAMLVEQRPRSEIRDGCRDRKAEGSVCREERARAPWGISGDERELRFAPLRDRDHGEQHGVQSASEPPTDLSAGGASEVRNLPLSVSVAGPRAGLDMVGDSAAKQIVERLTQMFIPDDDLELRRAPAAEVRSLVVALQPETLGTVEVVLKFEGSGLVVELGARELSTAALLTQDQDVLASLLEKVVGEQSLGSTVVSVRHMPDLAGDGAGRDVGAQAGNWSGARENEGRESGRRRSGRMDGQLELEGETRHGVHSASGNWSRIGLVV